ncbi:MAG: hypothetical protein GY841_04585 [FCB group bacterium]|nr:hypothetical protein [FCB group bacterium]
MKTTITHKTNTIPLTLNIKAKNGYLWQIVKLFGSQSKAAKYLGVSDNVFCRWINLRGTPHPKKTTKWQEIENKLLITIGKDMSQVFPEAIRSKDFLDMPKEIDVTKNIPIDNIEQMVCPSISQRLKETEQIEKLMDGMKYLTYREQEIIERRFGLTGKPQQTRLAIGKLCGVSRERVNQIEQKAMQKLKGYFITDDDETKRIKEAFCLTE